VTVSAAPSHDRDSLTEGDDMRRSHTMELVTATAVAALIGSQSALADNWWVQPGHAKPASVRSTRHTGLRATSAGSVVVVMDEPRNEPPFNRVVAGGK
jgi:hypothetical protein